ncbi:flagellar export protein FliJ [Hahella sp. KA22]|uniref:flagellar export protein FliJ n=1 Tax=Hahella sp. KA22 TaxID=1628392 RepID=UPI000FDD502A|nr:flagellar export protein FliJ [Hahella sp. KA22]AZZ90971.1 flagellar export protein FliJ [Hahella sp. KA22]QAY54341.1 flagellar export protein FliJ [Hahella sp. KA22]
MAEKKKSQRLSLVLDLAERDEENERKKMGEIRRRVEQAEGKLEQLVAYQRDYQDELRGTQNGVRSVRHIQTYHVFISRLGSAIEQQQQQLLLLKQQLSQQTEVWRAAYQKKNNMQDFIDRCKKEEAYYEDKKQQRNLDDAVGRRAYHNRH